MHSHFERSKNEKTKALLIGGIIFFAVCMFVMAGFFFYLSSQSMGTRAVLGHFDSNGQFRVTDSGDIGGSRYAYDLKFLVLCI